MDNSFLHGKVTTLEQAIARAKYFDSPSYEFLVQEIERQKKIIDELSLYFKSGNDIPVERATIYRKHFEEIVNGK